MHFFRQPKRNHVLGLWLLVTLFSTACSLSSQIEPEIAEITSPPTSDQPVEYGASLDEWEEATQANSDVTDEAETQADRDIVDVLDEDPPQADTAMADTPTQYILDDIVYQEIQWEGLVPAEFAPDVIMAKYEEQLAQIQDGSPEASDLYAKMQEEFNNAPANESLNETYVRIPGFIAPLEYSEERITKFLLVPYFGACIHVPAPPANQTVLVDADEDYGIWPERSYNPIWVMGKLTIQESTTELAQAGYYIQDAIIEPYNSFQ